VTVKKYETGLYDESELASFNIMEDRPVNNFIGEKRLEANLRAIDAKLEFNELKELDIDRILEGLSGILPYSYLMKIRDIIWRRWQNVAQFRFM